MIVEVLGPPGAGKTSLLPATIDAIGAWSGRNCESAADALDRHLRISGIGRLLAPMLATRPRRLRVIAVDVPYGIGFAVARPRLTLTAVLGILRAPVGWGHRRTLLARWIGVGARQHFLRGRLKNDVAVFDEGLYHRSVNLFAWRRTGPRREAALAVEVRAYLRMAPAPDLAIFVDGRDEVMAQRLAVRGLPLRLRGLPPARVARFLAAAGEIARTVPLTTADRTAWIRIMNTSTLDDATNQLGAGLRQLDTVRPPADERWPLTGERLLPLLRRPDRLWQRRPRSLDGEQRQLVTSVADALGLTSTRVLGTMGAGRSWNVLLQADSGPILLKRYKTSVEAAAIASEHAVLRQLAALALPAPRLVVGRDDATIVDRAGGVFAAFRYVDGRVAMHELLSSTAEQRRQVRAAGAALAILHQALADTVPAAYPRTGLGPDGARATPSAMLAEQLSGARRPHGASRGRMQAYAGRLCELDQRLASASLSTTLVHGDYGPYNILLRPGEPVLVIDFELARLDWRLLDLVTALPRFSISRAGFSRRRFDAFMGGYLEIAPAARSELIHAGALMELLSLRRAAVLFARNAEAPDRTVLSEAARRLGVAREIATGTNRLIGRLSEMAR
jgi:Ser/Thr protein kinase RdoA (MazF antagonist)